jgi:hypothetical protein
MEEKIVSFETAKLAKEKGFSLNCFGQEYYVSEIKLCKSNELLDKDLTCVYSAPTQSLLQKWLREEHNLYILLKTIYLEVWDKNGIRFSYCIEDYITEEVHGDETLIGYLTYEAALEAGLFKALKLI